jgi:hypothetical protein
LSAIHQQADENHDQNKNRVDSARDAHGRDEFPMQRHVLVPEDDERCQVAERRYHEREQRKAISQPEDVLIQQEIEDHEHDAGEHHRQVNGNVFSFEVGHGLVEQAEDKQFRLEHSDQ